MVPLLISLCFCWTICLKSSVIVNCDQKLPEKKFKLHLLPEICGQKRESDYMKIARKDNETKI